ncbi:uncharacterized protein LOC143831682 [Paroedura picta]|uniref:uncharacterized protein LOC143831682 n=1 Tax=Paroedura picta TaxID=143630 RepID=UPI0040575CE0
MDAPKDTTSKPFRTAQVNETAQSELSPVAPESFSDGDEDFFSGLSPEEAECLEYLLQTIHTVEGEILQDDGGAEIQHNQTSKQQSISKEAVPSKPVSKMKMIKALSEESFDIGLRRRPEPPALGSSHSSHFKKFDTIMKSGVNVQELRSRFLLHLDSSAEVKESPEAAARTMKRDGLLSGGQKSPRDEALRKLGLLQRNASFPTAKGLPLMIVSGQHDQMPLSEATLSSINTSGEPVERQVSVSAQEKVLLP